MGFGFSNDYECLYAVFYFRNPAWASLISMSGVKMWLDNTGEKKKECGLSFIGGSSMHDIRRSISDEGSFKIPEEGPMGRERSIENKLTVIDEKGGIIC